MNFDLYAILCHPFLVSFCVYLLGSYYVTGIALGAKEGEIKDENLQLGSAKNPTELSGVAPHPD